MSERTLYLHIGCHKTGTTSIQANLAANQRALKTSGLTHFREPRFAEAESWHNLHSWLVYKGDPTVVPHGMGLEEPSELAERLENLKGNVILSSENFSYFFEKCYIDEFRDALTPIFSSIKILCYIRRQDKHVISHHQEGAKSNRSPECDLFGQSTSAIPPYHPRHRLYLDYNRRLGMWADAFGDENMIIKIFDTGSLINGDVVDNFFKCIGLKNYKKQKNKNFSYGLVRSKIGHILNEMEIENL